MDNKYGGWGASGPEALLAITQAQGEAELRHRAEEGRAPTHEV